MSYGYDLLLPRGLPRPGEYECSPKACVRWPEHIREQEVAWPKPECDNHDTQIHNVSRDQRLRAALPEATGGPWLKGP